MATNIFGQRLKLLRSTLQLSQTEFAESLSIPQPTISGYEKGKNFPTIDVVVVIADKYKVSIDWLCGRDEFERDIIINNNAINRIKNCINARISNRNGNIRSYYDCAEECTNTTINILKNQHAIEELEDLKRVFNFDCN